MRSSSDCTLANQTLLGYVRYHSHSSSYRRQWLTRASAQLVGRPREYIQLHRDTTVNQLMFQTVLENGVIKYTDSPLLRAVTFGRVIVVDEADKAAEHVVAIFRSLAGHGQLTLADGRRVRLTKKRENDIVVHPNFRIILLANRPGYRACCLFMYSASR